MKSMNKIFTIVFALLIFSCDKKVSIKIDLHDISEQKNIEAVETFEIETFDSAIVNISF